MNFSLLLYLLLNVKQKLNNTFVYLQGLLHYHIINPYIPLSTIFTQMKAIKDNYIMIEDFTVGDITLEQVFISFARLQTAINTNP